MRAPFTISHSYQQRLVDGRTVSIPVGTRVQYVTHGPNTPAVGWYFDAEQSPPTLTCIHLPGDSPDGNP